MIDSSEIVDLERMNKKLNHKLGQARSYSLSRKDKKNNNVNVSIVQNFEGKPINDITKLEEKLKQAPKVEQFLAKCLSTFD